MDGVDRQPFLDPKEPAHSPGNTLGRVEIGAVREKLDVHVILLDPLDICTDHRNAFD